MYSTYLHKDTSGDDEILRDSDPKSSDFNRISAFNAIQLKSHVASCSLGALMLLVRQPGRCNVSKSGTAQDRFGVKVVGMERAYPIPRND